ncbi:MAG: hypothetical protein KGZ85_11910 [Ignavibacterium sp.]|nr:hypothetical protein [Ignavibacterium sp.]
MKRFPYILGVIVLAVAIYSAYQSSNFYIVVLAGILIIANLTAIRKVRQKNDLFNVILNMGNALLCFFIGMEFVAKEKTYIQYIYFLAAFIFLIATYVIYIRNLQPFKKFSSK